MGAQPTIGDTDKVKQGTLRQRYLGIGQVGSHKKGGFGMVARHKTATPTHPCVVSLHPSPDQKEMGAMYCISQKVRRGGVGPWMMDFCFRPLPSLLQPSCLPVPCHTRPALVSPRCLASNLGRARFRSMPHKSFDVPAPASPTWIPPSKCSVEIVWEGPSPGPADERTA